VTLSSGGIASKSFRATPGNALSAALFIFFLIERSIIALAGSSQTDLDQTSIDAANFFVVILRRRKRDKNLNRVIKPNDFRG
jgi:hypothetical protein